LFVKDIYFFSCSSKEYIDFFKLFLATCSVYGDSHYKTFDGKHFDYQGRCKHVMVTDKCVNSGVSKENILVESNSMSCGSQSVSCLKEIRATVYGTVFVLRKGVKNVEVIPNKSDERQMYQIYNYAGSYVVIVTEYGISFKWDNSTRIYITVESQLAQKLCGLCGNYDGNEANDFITIQGDFTGSSLIFGDSWRTQESCPLATEIVDSCKANPHRLDPSKKQCSIIKSKVFQRCHNLVNPIPYYDRCVFDVCSCDGIGECDCVCDAIAAYESECQAEGVFIPWRKGHKICGRYYKYSIK